MSEQFTRGRKSQLSALTASTDLYVGVRIDAQGATWDVSCFCLDTADRLSDDNYFIFYNQPRSPDGAVQKIDPQAGDGDGFRVALDQVAATIGRLSFCAALDGAGTASQLRSGYLRLVAGGTEVLRYPFTGADFGTERAIMIADIYRKGAWRVGAVGQGFAGGLADLIRSFGGTVDEEPPAAPPPAPPMAPPMAPPPGYGQQPPPGYGQPQHGQPAWQPERVAPGAMVSLQKYREAPTTGRWTRQNSKLVKVTLGPEAYARRGSMVAYQGSIDFDYKGSGGLRGFFEGAMTGQQLKLMTCRGSGEVFLAEDAADLHIVELAGQSLCINANNILAFDTTLQTQVQRIESPGIPGGGMFHLVVAGQGTVVVMTHGTPVTLMCQGPTFADVNAVVAWTAGMRVSVSTQVRVSRQIYAGASGESLALQFMGLQGHFVVVQPYEV